MDDRHSQRVGKADVLACRAEDAPASADEVADLEEPRKVMQRCIRSEPRSDFKVSGENVIMVVTVAVIAHGAALSYRGGVLGGDDAAAPRGGEEKLDRVYRLAHVPAAGGGDAFGSTVLERERSLPPRVHYIHSAIDRLLHILGGDGRTQTPSIG